MELPLSVSNGLKAGFTFIVGCTIVCPFLSGGTLKDVSCVKSNEGAMLYFPSEFLTAELIIA